jgi:hypothetical protein
MYGTQKLHKVKTMEILLTPNATSAYTTIKITDNEMQEDATMVITHIS